MRKVWLCIFYALCIFTIVFSLFWMALPKLSLPVPDLGSEAPPSSAADLAAQAMPELAAQSYRLCDKGGRVAVYRCGTNGQPDVLVTVTGIYTNLLPENDAVRIKRGVTVYSERELDLLLVFKIWAIECRMLNFLSTFTDYFLLTFRCKNYIMIIDVKFLNRLQRL